MNQAGTYGSVTTTSIPAALLHRGVNTLAVVVYQAPGKNDGSSNPTMFQAELSAPTQ